jgi:toxin YoeB
MSYKIDFSKGVQKTIKKWKKPNQEAFLKLHDDILPELAEHPKTGKGRPEPLKGGKNITYSRHITANDRIIYDIYEETISILVVEIERHYKEK